jgi:hypothetical protein
MEQSKDSNSGTRAVIERPRLAVLVTGDGRAEATGIGPESARQARIREAAYARYEGRGCLHGHDVDDWLAAEADVDGKH